LHCTYRVVSWMYRYTMEQLAATYANSTQSETAIPHYLQALQLRPTYARGWLNLGISYANLDRYEEAAKAYAQALHLNPDAR
jgi:peroxin-5